jgi:uncharacterized membrane-anchored protein
MNAYSSTKQQTARHPSWQSLTKVPKITVFFWIIKILTTAMGEATSDYLDHRFNPYVAGMIAFIALVFALTLQFKQDRYRPYVYWFAVAMVAVFGTMAADGLHVELGIPYVASALFYAIVLIVVFVAWYKSEGTLSIHSVRTPRREIFYWLTVLSTFAMGTALGDLTATTFGFGYLGAGILFAIIFALPGLAYWRFRINAIFAFWFAYIITRPLGASFADWMGVPKNVGGLNLGRGLVSLGLSGAIILVVTFVTITRKDAQARDGS